MHFEQGRSPYEEATGFWLAPWQGVSAMPRRDGLPGSTFWKELLFLFVLSAGFSLQHSGQRCFRFNLIDSSDQESTRVSGNEFY